MHLVFFLVLCVVPPRDASVGPRLRARGLGRLVPESAAGSAIAAAILAIVIVLFYAVVLIGGHYWESVYGE